MSLALYPSRVRSSDLLGVRVTWHFLGLELAVFAATKGTADRGIKVTNDARIIVGDSVDVEDREVPRVISVFLSFLT